jgi:CubicO group peptidase (beta-lactamase class C family)
MRMAVMFSACLLLASCSTKQSGKTMLSGLDSLLTAEFRADEPGGAVLVMKGDSVMYQKCIGLADLGTKQEITLNTLFNLGSISKTFVANGILILEGEGKLSLADPMSRYFPEFKSREIADAVTVAHLLTHTSGLPDNRPVSENPEFFITAKDYDNFAPVMKAEKLNFQPGERYEYSNPAFNGLALIIEKVSGQKWQQFIAERIFAPAGMVTSTITDGPHPDQGVAHAYELADGEWLESDYGEFPTFPAAGNGGVWSSVRNWPCMRRPSGRTSFLMRSSLRGQGAFTVPRSGLPLLLPALVTAGSSARSRSLRKETTSVSDSFTTPATREVSGHSISQYQKRICSTWGCLTGRLKA